MAVGSHLLLHQLWTDILRTRLLLGLWWVLLLLDLGGHLGWFRSMRLPQNSLDGFIDEFWSAWVVAIVVGTALLLLATVIVEDSPARAGGFLKTRPMPATALWLAKGLYVVVGLAIPAAVQEAVHLAACGWGAGTVLQGALERWVLLLMACGAIGGFVALWGSLRECALGILAGLGGYAVGLGVLLLLWIVGRRVREIDDVGAGEFVVWLFLLMIGLPALAAFGARRGWSVGQRAWRVAGLTVLVMTVGGLCPKFPVGAGAGAARSRAGTPPASELRVPSRSIQIRTVRTTAMPFNSESAGQAGRTSFAIDLAPRFDAMPAGASVVWRPLSLRVTGVSGRSVEGHVLPFRGASWALPPAVRDTRIPDTRVLASLVGPGTIFRNVGLSGVVPGEPESALQVGILDVGAGGIPRDELVYLECTLAGDLHAWEPLADLPLEQGATFRDHAGSWTVLSWRRVDFWTEVLLRVEHLQLALSRDPRTARSRFWHFQYAFVLVQPELREAALPWHPPWPMVQRAWYTASPQQLFLAQFPTANPPVTPWTDGDLRNGRLRIFRKAGSGTITREWQSPPFRFRASPASGPPAPARSDTPLSLEELRRRIAALPEPTSSSSRAEVGRYLFDVLTLAETALPTRLPYEDPIIERLARLVPAHLPLFLEGARPDASSCSYVLLEALKRGTPADQKEAIFEALADNPYLREVVVRRGWFQEARPAFRKLWEAPGPLPWVARGDILEFRDPASYPRLIEEFEADPSLDFYESLRDLPGIKDQLESALERLWVERRRDFAGALSGAWRLSVLMRAGRQEALEEALRLWWRLAADERASQVALVEALRDNIASLPPTSPNEASLAEWLEGKRPEVFRFDPVLRHFVTP